MSAQPAGRSEWIGVGVDSVVGVDAVSDARARPGFVVGDCASGARAGTVVFRVAGHRSACRAPCFDRIAAWGSRGPTRPANRNKNAGETRELGGGLHRGLAGAGPEGRVSSDRSGSRSSPFRRDRNHLECSASLTGRRGVGGGGYEDIHGTRDTEVPSPGHKRGRP
jgi:hypothetical protein